MIVAGDHVAKFVGEQLGFVPCPPFTNMGIERDGEVVAGILFNCFEGANVHVSAAGKGWTLPFLRAVGVYVFEQLGCTRMTFTSEQIEVVRYAQRLGGQIEGLMRDHFGEGRDAIIVGVLAREWKFR